MEHGKPHGLTEVGALAGHLVVEPLFGIEVFGGTGSEADGVLLIVCLDQVLHDGTRLPQVDASVGVLDGGDTAVGVDLLERLLLHLGELEELGFVWDVEFLEDGDHLPGVGAGDMAVEDNGLERHDDGVLVAIEVCFFAVDNVWNDLGGGEWLSRWGELALYNPSDLLLGASNNIMPDAPQCPITTQY